MCGVVLVFACVPLQACQDCAISYLCHCSPVGIALLFPEGALSMEVVNCSNIFSVGFILDFKIKGTLQTGKQH